MTNDNLISFIKMDNTTLFDKLCKIKLYNIQNYIPIYDLLFKFNDEYELNLKCDKIIYNVKKVINDNLIKASVYNVKLKKGGNKHVFLKISGIINPIKYLIGKYKNKFNEIMKLPKNDKPNNFTYIDGFFYYLSSKLLNNYNFINGIDFYGSFTGIKQNFLFNISEDLSLLQRYPYFKKNNGILYKSKYNLSKKTSLIIIDEEEDDSTINYDDEIIISIKEFPVHLLCLEKCVETFNYLIFNEQITNEMWVAYLMQIIMTLITYQDKFNMTHNDLHTNNIMFIHTRNRFIYYKYNGILYKVPSYGKIFKIIDFGRSIYNYRGLLLYSNCFEKNEDAEGQYNMPPFLKKNKPVVLPNKSFDLCRLACSIFDEVVQDKRASKLVDLPDYLRIILEWCHDDRQINIYAKKNGEERYPDFKLYKKIAANVHNHTPHNQLNRPEFQSFEYHGDRINKRMFVDIDSIPNFSLV
jgi:hypothetical protein